MARDIEEFLRRAAERRQQQKKGGQKPPPRPQPPQQRQQPPRRQQPVEPEIIEVVPAKEVRQKPQSRLKPRKKTNLRKKESVAEHVKSHIDTSDIAAHAEQLGDRIENIHNQVDAMVHKHLDHDLTEIDDNPTITDDRPAKIFGKPSDKFAQELRELLGNKKMVGKAVILAEILKRPNF